MERQLAMNWWNELPFDNKINILKKNNRSVILPLDKLTGKEIEQFYIKEHKPINV